MKSIFLYCDEGVCPSSLRATVRSLKFQTNCPVQLVKRDFFTQKKWEDEAAMIIFPGGRDVPYLEALRGEPNRRIRDYVIHGGCYFGICAGAYYASASICFESGGELEVIGLRELSFFPGCASGPALGLRQFAYENQRGAKITSLTLSAKYFTQSSIKAYYNGGCSFEKTADYPNVAILAHYEEISEKTPAIILCQVGKGKAVLSGVHPEYFTEDLPNHQNRKNSLFQDLIAILLTRHSKKKSQKALVRQSQIKASFSSWSARGIHS